MNEEKETCMSYNQWHGNFHFFAQDHARFSKRGSYELHFKGLESLYRMLHENRWALTASGPRISAAEEWEAFEQEIQQLIDRKSSEVRREMKEGRQRRMEMRNAALEALRGEKKP